MTLSTRQYLDPYIIAEIGVNHEGSLNRAKEMVDAVARAGGHAAKFQTYKAELLASRQHSQAYWDQDKEPTASQFELFGKLDSFGMAEYEQLAEHCRLRGIDFLSTPFDLPAVDQLNPLLSYFKVASADLTNLPLLRKVAGTGKPVILSVGASTTTEISLATEELQRNGAGEIVLLHCVLRYPTPAEVANVRAISTLIRNFGHLAAIGYSDHVEPGVDGSTPALDLAAIQGARVIEKHFTDDRTGRGNDHYHAVDEASLGAFVTRLRTFRELAGSGVIDVSDQQAAIGNARRRIFASRYLKAGEVLSEDNLIPLRASVGIEVSRWDDVVGRKLKVDKALDDPITDDDLLTS